MPNFRPSLSGNFLDVQLSNLDPANSLNVDINLNGNKGVNAGYPVNQTDLANKQYVDDQAGGGGGANIHLSNLSNTAINDDLIPDTNQDYKIGSETHMFNELWVKEIIGSDNLSIGTISDTVFPLSISVKTGDNPTDSNAPSGLIELETGANIIPAGGGGFATGLISLKTGAGTNGSGGIFLTTGGLNDPTNPFSSSGSIDVSTGIISSSDPTIGFSGQINIRTGESGKRSGNIDINTGLSRNEDSGDIILRTGIANNGNKGKVKLTSTVLQVASLIGDPLNGEAGDIYLNISTGKFRGFNGTTWVDLN